MGVKEFKNVPKNNTAEKDHEKVGKDLVSGAVNLASSNAPADTSIAMRPLVPHPLSGLPVAETSDQARINQALNGELYTKG